MNDHEPNKARSCISEKVKISNEPKFQNKSNLSIVIIVQRCMENGL